MTGLNLSKSVKFVRAILPSEGVAGTSDINGATVDMQGYQSIAVIVQMGAITASAVTSLKWQQGAQSGMGYAADLAGTAQTIADDDDEELFYSDFHQPTERYVRVVIDRGTQNAVVAGAWYVLYNGVLFPTTHGTGVSGEFHQSPAEGTA